MEGLSGSLANKEMEHHDTCSSFESEVENVDSSLFGDDNKDDKRSSDNEEHCNAPMLEESEVLNQSPTKQVSDASLKVGANVCKLLSTLLVAIGACVV